MSMIGICTICGRPASATCTLCGRIVCAQDMDSMSRVCRVCAGTTRKARTVS